MSNFKRVDGGVFRIIIGGKGQRIINEIFPFARSGQNAHEITPGCPMKLQKWFKSYLNILFCIELFTLFNSVAWRYASHLPVTVTNTVNLDEICLWIFAWNHNWFNFLKGKASLWKYSMFMCWASFAIFTLHNLRIKILETDFPSDIAYKLKVII